MVLEVIFSVPDAKEQPRSARALTAFRISQCRIAVDNNNPSPHDTCIESWSSVNVFEMLCRTYQWLAFPFLLTSKTSSGLYDPQNWNILGVFSCGVEILQESAHRLCLSYLGDAEPTLKISNVSFEGHLLGTLPIKLRKIGVET